MANLLLSPLRNKLRIPNERAIRYFASAGSNEVSHSERSTFMPRSAGSLGYQMYPSHFHPPPIPGITKATIPARPTSQTKGKYSVPMPPEGHPMKDHVDPKYDWLAPVIGTACFLGPFFIFPYFI